ncbi:hypothetical protein [Spiroplasma endosymbiont of Phycita roborella]|uniref:hypothetical protein n=1 Tax=Spiroplasma endosymbiont of Phycita roborella TaxID=3066311 RepID=UPI00313ABC1F
MSAGICNFVKCGICFIVNQVICAEVNVSICCLLKYGICVVALNARISFLVNFKIFKISFPLIVIGLGTKSFALSLSFLSNIIGFLFFKLFSSIFLLSVSEVPDSLFESSLFFLVIFLELFFIFFIFPLLAGMATLFRTIFW